jgi:hypothetical protein
MTLEKLKAVAVFSRDNYQTFELVTVATEHFTRLVEIADAAKAFVSDKESSFRLLQALSALEAE